jgi:hypothetical protein
LSSEDATSSVVSTASAAIQAQPARVAAVPSAENTAGAQQDAQTGESGSVAGLITFTSTPVDDAVGATLASGLTIVVQTTDADGATVTVSSVALSGATLIMNQNTKPQPSVAILSSTGPASVSALTIGSATLLPGSAAAIISGQTISLDKAGTAVIVDGTSTLALVAAAKPTQAAISYVAIGGGSIQRGSVATVVPGTTYSLDPAGSALVVDGATQPLASVLTTDVPRTTAASTQPDGNQVSYVTVGAGSILRGSPATVISGMTYSLDAEGTALVVDGATQALPSTLRAGAIQTTYVGSDALTLVAVQASPTSDPEADLSSAKASGFSDGTTSSGSQGDPIAAITSLGIAGVSISQAGLSEAGAQGTTSLEFTTPRSPTTGRLEPSNIADPLSSQQNAATSTTRICWGWALLSWTVFVGFMMGR